MNNNKEKYKILIFKIGQQSYGLPIAMIDRVLRAAEVTPIPSLPLLFLGMININGQIIPVIDTDIFLKLSENKSQINPDDCFLLITTQSRTFILIVDSVKNMIEISHREIDQTAYANIIKNEGEIIFILDLNPVTQEIKKYASSITSEANKVPL